MATKPIRTFSKPWFGPRKALNLVNKQVHGRKVTLQERAMVSLLRVEAKLKKRKQPIPLIVVQSFRTHAEQRAIYNSGVRPAAQPGTSWHEQGIAVDIYFKPRDLSAIRKAFKSEGWHQFDPVNDPGHFSKGVTG